MVGKIVRDVENVRPFIDPHQLWQTRTYSMRDFVHQLNLASDCCGSFGVTRHSYSICSGELQ